MIPHRPGAAPTSAVILAGGLGTRMGSLARHDPKPVLTICDRPVLEYQIENLCRYGVRDVLVVTGHLGDRVRARLGDGSALGVRISYYQEEAPLGTAGALVRLHRALPERFFVTYGDLVFDIAFDRMARFHEEHGAGCTLVAHPNDHPRDSDVLEVDAGGVVTGILPKNADRQGYHHNLVNAGVFLFERRMLARGFTGDRLDLERDVIRPALAGRDVHAYVTTEYVRDMGTPERMASVTEHVRRGVVARRNLSRAQRAVFLDRDGTLNEHVGFVTRPEELRLIEGAASALRVLNGSEFLAIVVTNQPVIARGQCSVGQLETIHRKLETDLGTRHAYLDALYYCPHHPDRGFRGEDPRYKVDCACRKPRTGLIDRAATAFNIDRDGSWMVGDTTRDVQTGLNAGLRTILVRTGEAGRDGRYPAQPHATADTLLGAVLEHVCTGA